MGDPPLTAFAPEHVDALPGPEWLRARRASALERLSSSAWPTEQDEDWRYSRIAELDLDRFRPEAGGAGPGAESGGGASAAAVPASVEPILAAVGSRAGLIVIRNGIVAHVECDEKLRAAGVVVASARDLDGGDGLVGQVATDVDAISYLHDAFLADIAVLRIPPGTVLEDPVVVVQWTDGELSASFPHLVVEAGEQSEVTVAVHSGSAAVEALTVPVVEVDAGPAANVRVVGVQDLGDQVWQVASLFTRAQRDATVTAWLTALGGRYARWWVDAHLAGPGATAQLHGLYFGDGDRMHDFRSMQLHDGPKATSSFLLKGAVVDQARGVYTGTIRVLEGARGTDAFLTNRNLVLADGARVDSVPNLEIENENDLARCGHGAATGPVDEDHLFYLESRGVPTEVAERLIVFGFFDEVLAGVPVPGLRDVLREAITVKLDKVGR